MSNDEACAPCGAVDMTPRINNLLPQLESAESFADCCGICDGNLGRRREGPRGSRSATVTMDTDTCRCLCRTLKLNGACPGKQYK